MNDSEVIITPSLFKEIPVQIGPQDDPPVNTMSVASAVQTYILVEAKAKAETAELQKRLALQNFRPCKLYPTIIYHDGLRWVCGYGMINNQYSDFLPEAAEDAGVVAYGMSPEESMQNFDRMWCGTDNEDEDEDIEDEDDLDDLEV